MPGRSGIGKSRIALVARCEWSRVNIHTFTADELSVGGARAAERGYGTVQACSWRYRHDSKVTPTTHTIRDCRRRVAVPLVRGKLTMTWMIGFFDRSRGKRLERAGLEADMDKGRYFAAMRCGSKQDGNAAAE